MSGGRPTYREAVYEVLVPFGWMQVGDGLIHRPGHQSAPVVVFREQPHDDIEPLRPFLREIRKRGADLVLVE